MFVIFQYTTANTETQKTIYSWKYNVYYKNRLKEAKYKYHIAYSKARLLRTLILIYELML